MLIKIIKVAIFTQVLGGMLFSQTLNVPDNIGTSTVSGNVGIGTTSPNSKLQIKGSADNLSIPVLGFEASGNINMQGYISQSAGGCIGIHANNVLQLSTANGTSTYTPRLTIDTNGNVGIGTINLSHRLNIASIPVADLVWNSSFLNPINVTGTNWGSGVKLQLDGSSNWWGDDKWAGIAAIAETNWGNNVGLAIFTQGNLGTDPGNAPTEKVRITGGGNVGIGITNPLEITEKLIVDGNIVAKGDISFEGIQQIDPNSTMIISGYGSADVIWISSFLNPTNVSTTDWGSGIKLQLDGGTQWYAADKWAGIAAVAEKSWGDKVGLAFYTQDNIGTESPANPPTEKIRISCEGYLGIATNDPAYPLDVYGTIRTNGLIKADEIQVTENGADFVFEPDYDLPTLEEVESHIKEHKHLPDIPSAEDMQANGVNMGEMQTKLLQKIEELTLYVIEQEKKNSEQQRKITALENELAAIKSFGLEEK